jgi:hypothetical protein
MKRSLLLAVVWFALAGMLWRADVVRADKGPPPSPDCSSCDCAEDYAWRVTDEKLSDVLTVYDSTHPDDVGVAVKTAAKVDATARPVYHTDCLKDFNQKGDLCRVLRYSDPWNQVCKRTVAQNKEGLIATAYDKTSPNYSYPEDKDQRLRYSYTCGPQD